MEKVLLKQFRTRRIFLIGCTDYYDMVGKRSQIKKLMSEQNKNVEFIYQGNPSKLKPYQAERVVDLHPMIGSYSGGKYRNYMNLMERSDLTAPESFQSALVLFSQQYGYYPEHILVVQV